MDMHKTILAATCLTGMLIASPAGAQFQPVEPVEPVTGESYHIEFGTNLWFPNPDMVIQSESLGILGTESICRTTWASCASVSARSGSSSGPAPGTGSGFSTSR